MTINRFNFLGANNLVLLKLDNFKTQLPLFNIIFDKVNKSLHHCFVRLVHPFLFKRLI